MKSDNVGGILETHDSNKDIQYSSNKDLAQYDPNVEESLIKEVGGGQKTSSGQRKARKKKK